ncbi:MAG: hypothetical protein ACR2HR_15150 [Euzebya sp.]
MELLLPLFFLIPFVLVFASLGVWIWGLIDALLVPADVFYRTGSKVLWGVLIGVVGPLAAIVYFIVGRPDKPTRDWLKAQRLAGVDLRAYQYYNQPITGPGGPFQPHGPGPGYAPSGGPSVPASFPSPHPSSPPQGYPPSPPSF